MFCGRAQAMPRAHALQESFRVHGGGPLGTTGMAGEGGIVPHLVCATTNRTRLPVSPIDTPHNGKR